MKKISALFALAVVLVTSLAYADYRLVRVEAGEDSGYWYSTEESAASSARTRINNALYDRCRALDGFGQTSTIVINQIWCSSRANGYGGQQHFCTGTGNITCKIYDN